jgi:hypothetical protein
MPTTRLQAKKQALTSAPTSDSTTSESDSTNAPGPSARDDAPFDIDTNRVTTPPPQNEAGGMGPTVQDSPFAHKIAGSNVYTSMHLFRDSKMVALGLEMQGKFLGPMPVDLFLAEFLPCTGDTTVSKIQRASLKEASIQKAETPMYASLVSPHPIHQGNSGLLTV